MLAGDGSNFVEWYFLVKVNVGGLGKKEHLIELCLEEKEEAKLWLAEDKRLFSQIVNCIDRKMALSMQHIIMVKEL